MVEPVTVETNTKQMQDVDSELPFLNFGCGHVRLTGAGPGEKPGHNYMIPDEIFAVGRQWVNADKVKFDGVHQVSMTEFPFPWPDNMFGGVLLSHVVEHIPHEITIRQQEHPRPVYDASHHTQALMDKLAKMQDGWYAFWSELYRVCTPDAIAHVVCPYGWSQGAIADPTHTRMIVEHTFTHQLSKADRESSNTFEYQADCDWVVEGEIFMDFNQRVHHLIERQQWDIIRDKIMHEINVVNNLYVRLRAVK